MEGVNRVGADWLNLKKWLRNQREAAMNNMLQPLMLEDYHRLRGEVLMIDRIIGEVEPTKSPEVYEDDYGISKE